MPERKKSLEQRLENLLELKARFESMLDAVEDRNGDFDRADDIEEYLIKQMREITKEALNDWAVRKENEKTSELRGTTENAKHHSKKNSGGIRLAEK
ncbi:MAG: hypothetical protein GY748_07755 [Planctomycetaceae bacterium]|nr:hypothetical protein [Planctomycetaceae bacterium]